MAIYLSNDNKPTSGRKGNPGDLSVPVGALLAGGYLILVGYLLLWVCSGKPTP